MIIDSVFQEFIKVVQENRNYTIGLVNGDGKVTACSDENLIGSVQNVDAPDSNNLFSVSGSKMWIMAGSGCMVRMRIWK